MLPRVQSRRALLLLACSALAPASEEKPAEKFVAEWNLWGAEQQHAPKGTIGVGEIRQWQRVKSAWRKLEKLVDRYYRGE